MVFAPGVSPRIHWRAIILGVAVGLFVFIMTVSSSGAADGPIHLKIVGGVAGVSQYTQYEEPFWLRDVPRLTEGRVQAEIHPFDQTGLSGAEALRLMRLGVVPFGTALLALVSGDEPELNAVDLPLLNPDMVSLRATVGHYRAHLAELLHRKYDINLLGIYVYPAQVLFCARPFANLRDLKGRKVRTSSVGQSEMMDALGAIPVQIPFQDIVRAIRNNVADCAITGTLSGNEIGLGEVTSYISPMAISWGLSFFGANESAWRQLPADIQERLARGIGTLEQSIWDAADRETVGGLACDAGAPSCSGGRISHMTLVPVTAEDNALRGQLLSESILPRWLRRCGNDCAAAWNAAMGYDPAVQAKAE